MQVDVLRDTEQQEVLPWLQGRQELVQQQRMYARQEVATDIAHSWDIPAQHLLPKKKCERLTSTAQRVCVWVGCMSRSVCHAGRDFGCCAYSGSHSGWLVKSVEGPNSWPELARHGQDGVYIQSSSRCEIHAYAVRAAAVNMHAGAKHCERNAGRAVPHCCGLRTCDSKPLSLCMVITADESWNGCSADEGWSCSEWLAQIQALHGKKRELKEAAAKAHNIAGQG